MKQQVKVAIIWPPLCERFGYYRFDPRISIMSLGYLASYVESIENCFIEQINIDKLIHMETDIWREMDLGGMLLENKCIEEYMEGIQIKESDLYDQAYSYLINLKDWSQYDMVAVSYDLNYLKDRYAPAFYRFLSEISKKYGVKISFGGLGFPSIEILKLFKRFPFIDYLQFGNIDSVNLESFKNIILHLFDPERSNDDLINVYYRKKHGIGVNFFKEKVKASTEKKFIICPKYNMKDNSIFRTRYKEFYQFDKGFTTEDQNDNIEIPVIPYRFSVGCINHCAFCMSSADGKIFAYKSAEEVVDDIERLMEENDSKYFMFLNSMINFSIKYLDELHSIMMRRNVKIMFTDSAEFHGMSKDVLCMLKEMGAIGLWFGLECPSDRILHYIHKNCTVAEAEEVLKITDSLGIWNGVNLIAGLPHERDEDIDKTVDFIKCNWPFVNMWQVTPFYLVRSKFLETPEKYDIKIINRYATVDKGEGDMLMATFDEIGGLKWDEKQRKTAESFKLFLDTIDKYAQVPNISNTTFLFYAYEKFNGNKDLIKNWLIKNYSGKAPEIKVTGLRRD